MRKLPLPKEILEQTSEVHRFRHSKRSVVIYGLILIMLISSILSLPFIPVPVYSSARGILKPGKSRVPLALIIPGKVKKSRLIPNAMVKQGDTLLQLEDSALKVHIESLQNQIDKHQACVADLDVLLTDDITTQPLTTAQYQKEYQSYIRAYAEYRLRLRRSYRRFKRQKALLVKGVIAQAEYDASEFEHALARSDMLKYKSARKNSWQSERIQKQDELNRLRQELEQKKERSSHAILIAPVSGHLTNVIPLETNNLVTAGTLVAEISPDDALIAECYLSPREVGWIQPLSEVSFQIDAFNYNQWGKLTGTVMEIGKDVEYHDDQAVFTIRCRLQNDFLELKNGYRAYLFKGLTFTARFQQAERSLMELLSDSWDDWFTP